MALSWPMTLFATALLVAGSFILTYTSVVSLARRRGERILRHHERETMRLYFERHGERVGRLVDELYQHGLIDRRQARRMKNPKRPEDLEKIAAILEELGHG
jgi:hypothetical protein